MTERSAAQKVNALITLYIKLWTKRYGTAPTINRYREKWGFSAMLDDLGEQRAREVIEFYLSTNRFNHPLLHLFRNYDKLLETKESIEDDKEKRKQLLLETQARVQEWELRNVNN